MEYTNYVYVYMDPRKPGEYKYGNYIFEFEPFYIGKSKTNTNLDRMNLHTKFVREKNRDLTNNTYKFNIIKSILDSNMEPIVSKVEGRMNLEASFNLEKLLIHTIGNRYVGNGPLVNITSGGDGGDVYTNNPRHAEMRKKLSIFMSGSGNPRYGVKLDENPSHIAKENGEHWNKGRVASDETRSKISKQRNGKLNAMAYKVGKFDLLSNLIETYDYAKDCAIKNGINYSHFINRVIKKSKPHLGFIYKKIEIDVKN